MKKIIFIIITNLIAVTAFTQFVHKIKADSVLITNDSCTAELNLENRTKDTLGFLYNKGKGRTEFRRGMIKLNDSVYVIGTDTLRLSASLSNLIAANGLTKISDTIRLGGDLQNNTAINLKDKRITFNLSDASGAIAPNAGITISGARTSYNGADYLYIQSFQRPTTTGGSISSFLETFLEPTNTITSGGYTNYYSVHKSNNANINMPGASFYGFRTSFRVGQPNQVFGNMYHFYGSVSTGPLAGMTNHYGLYFAPLKLPNTVGTYAIYTAGNEDSIFNAGPVRWPKYKNNASEDSVLTTDINGNIKLKLAASGGGSGNGWNITGNAETNSGINFLGTTDNVSLRFRTNNIQRAVIDSNGNVGIGTSNVVNEKLYVETADNTNFTTSLYNAGGVGRVLKLNTGGAAGQPILDAQVAGGSVFRINAAENTTNMGVLDVNHTSNTAWVGVMKSVSAGFGKVLLLTTGSTDATTPIFQTKYNTSTDAFTVFADGHVSSSGNVGIGTTNPTEKLHLYGTNPNFFIEGDPNSYAGGIRIKNQIGDAIINNYGITSHYFGLMMQTKNPQNNLSSQIGITPGGAVAHSLDPGATPFKIVSAPYQQSDIFRVVKDISTTNNGVIIESPVVVVNKDGNVGIGTTSPSYKLDVNGDARVSNLPFLASRDTVLTYDPSTKQLKVTKITSGSSGWGLTGNAATNSGINFLGTTDNISLRLQTNNIQRAVIDSNGRVGINTTTPTYQLDVNGNARISNIPFIASRDTVLTYDPSTKQMMSTKVNAGPSSIKLTADLPVYSATALTNATGLSFVANANTYYHFKFLVVFSTVATTTGIRLSISAPAAPAVLSAKASIPVAADGVGGEFQGWITASDDVVIGTGVQAANTNYVAIVEGTILTGATAGTVQLRYGSEVGGSGVTIKRASLGQLTVY